MISRSKQFEGLTEREFRILFDTVCRAKRYAFGSSPKLTSSIDRISVILKRAKKRSILIEKSKDMGLFQKDEKTPGNGIEI